jgi:hypothetical protein
MNVKGITSHSGGVGGDEHSRDYHDSHKLLQ